MVDNNYWTKYLKLFNLLRDRILLIWLKISIKLFGTSIFPYQVGGHMKIIRARFGNKKFILKPLDLKEINFFCLAYSSNINKYSLYKNYIPTYYGEIKINQKRYIIMENLVQEKSNNSINIIDIKIGNKRINDLNDDRKIWRVIYKDLCSTTRIFGYRIIGVRISNQIIDKKKCLRICRNSKTMLGILKIFIKRINKKHRESLKKKMIECYNQIQNSKIRLHSSSIIIIYNGNDPPKFKLIDFARYDPDPKNYLGKEELFLKAIINITNLI